jgi:hypothetical protein
MKKLNTGLSFFLAVSALFIMNSVSASSPAKKAKEDKVVVINQKVCGCCSCVSIQRKVHRKPDTKVIRG